MGVETAHGNVGSEQLGDILALEWDQLWENVSRFPGGGNIFPGEMTHFKLQLPPINREGCCMLQASGDQEPPAL